MDHQPQRLVKQSALERAARDRLSRRQFLARSGGAAATITGTATISTAGATVVPLPDLSPKTGPLAVLQYPAVPEPPAEPPRELTTLSEEEAATIEALMARILPGDADDPGAREAGVIYYLDHLLGVEGGFPEATYREGPYALPYDGDAPPTDEEAALAEGTVWVPADEIERYGYQSPLTSLEVYRLGVGAVNAYAQEQFGQPVPELNDDQLDQIVTALLENEATGFDHFSPEAFFHTLRRHVAEGMFSDPAYGGNRDFAGWRLVGYPGSQRAYTETDIRTPGSARSPQGLAELPHFHAGQPAEHFTVVQPVRGSADEDQVGQEPDENEEDS